MKKNKTKLTLQDSNLRLPARMLFLTLYTVALPTELKVNVAAIGVTQFFYRGHTSRLKFVFSLQLFFTERMFLQYRWLYPTKNFAYMSPLNWFSAVAVPATTSSDGEDLWLMLVLPASWAIT